MANVARLKQEHDESGTVSPQGVLIFGPPKSGKTELVGKLSEHFNLLWFDLENGHTTLFKLPTPWQERIELIAIPDTASYPMAAETMLKVIKGKPVKICDAHGKVACPVCNKAKANFVEVHLDTISSDWIVVMDSASQLATSMMDQLTRGEPDDYKCTFNDYGDQGRLMAVVMGHLQNARYHRCVISHEVEAETEGKKKKLVPVGGTRNFSRNMGKYFDHVIYVEVKNKKHVFSSSTTAATNILTGSRTDVAIENLPEATLLAIFKPDAVPGLAVTKVDDAKPTTKPTTIADKARATARAPANTPSKLKQEEKETTAQMLARMREKKG